MPETLDPQQAMATLTDYMRQMGRSDEEISTEMMNLDIWFTACQHEPQSDLLRRQTILHQTLNQAKAQGDHHYVVVRGVFLQIIHHHLPEHLRMPFHIM